MAFCKFCKNKIPDGAKICPKCHPSGQTDNQAHEQKLTIQSSKSELKKEAAQDIFLPIRIAMNTVLVLVAVAMFLWLVILPAGSADNGLSILDMGEIARRLGGVGKFMNVLLIMTAAATVVSFVITNGNTKKAHKAYISSLAGIAIMLIFGICVAGLGSATVKCSVGYFTVLLGLAAHSALGVYMESERKNLRM